jgi:hypothetical protein
VVVPEAGREVDIDGLRFSLVCVRGTGVAVYRGEGTYLRLGDAVAGELDVHRQMLRDGHPVAKILGVGELRGSLYYIESDLGETTFGDGCEDRVAQCGSMPSEEFDRFLDIMRRHAHAQLTGTQRSGDIRVFGEFIGVDSAAANNPHLATMIQTAWHVAASVLGDLPSTLQHGDLHVFNTCPGGIIDLEVAGWAPIGYDVATAVLVPTLAAPRWVAGTLAIEWFTPDQVRVYLELLDKEFYSANLPVPSTQLHAHLACRAINLCSRIHRSTKTWQARQAMLAGVLSAFVETHQIPLSIAL